MLCGDYFQYLVSPQLYEILKPETSPQAMSISVLSASTSVLRSSVSVCERIWLSAISWFIVRRLDLNESKDVETRRLFKTLEILMK